MFGKITVSATCQCEKMGSATRGALMKKFSKHTNTNTNIYFSLKAWHTIDSQAAVTGNG
jgi:hypothetical protein